MEVIVILILASLGVAGLFLGVFIWATRSGQFDDTTTPALRMLTDDPRPASREHAVVEETQSARARPNLHPRDSNKDGSESAPGPETMRNSAGIPIETDSGRFPLSKPQTP